MNQPRFAAVAGAFAIFLRVEAASAQLAPPAVPVPSLESSFTIETALAAMRRSHPLLRAAESSIRVAEGNATTAGHWTNPLLDASYVQAVRNSSYDRSGVPAVGITQFLELSGAPTARRQSAQAELRATQADKDAIARELEWTVREAFVRLAASYERQQVQRDAVADLERAANIVRARVASGMAPRYDASRMQIALEQAHADLAEAEAVTVLARGDFAVAVGPGSSELQSVPKLDLSDVRPPPALQEALDAARNRRPDIVAARRRVDAATIDVDLARRSVFPGIALRIGAAYGQSTGQFDVAAGVTVPLPILERGQGTIVAAQARADENRYVADALTTLAGQRVQAAHAEYLKRIESLARFRAQTSSVSDGMRAEAEAGYREAKLSVLELVDAYQSLRDARLRLLDLEQATQLAEVALGRAVGAQGKER